jgi:hypothetical protein
MANGLLTPKVFARTGLKMLKNNLVAAKLVNSDFKDEFKKIGDTVYVKRRPRFTVRDGAVAVPQDVVEGEVAVKIDQQKGVDVQFTSVEETLTVDALMKSKTLEEAMATLAQAVDSAVVAETLNIPNWVGTPGQIVDSATDFMLAPKRLDNGAIPGTGRFALMGPNDHYGLVANFTTLNTQRGVAEDALRQAELPPIGGVKPYMTQSVINLTTGSRTNGAVNGGSQAVAYTAVKSDFKQSLIIDGVGAAGTIKHGEVFTLAGVYAINPRTRATLDYLQQFTVLADVTADGSGNATVSITPPIIASGAFQNASAGPADNAVLTWMGSASTIYPFSTVLRPDAITLASAKMVMPFSGEADYETDPDTGITVRYWRYSDGTNDLHNHRWDILFGTKTVDGSQGTRLSGTA